MILQKITTFRQLPRHVNALLLLRLVLATDCQSLNGGALNYSAQHQPSMPERRIVPVISSLNDFSNKLPDFLEPNKTISILMDYDGTLAPISGNPNTTVIPTDLEDILHKFAKHPSVFLTVISGRALRNVQAKVGIKHITYSGNHGLEIENPDGTRLDYPLTDEMRKSYRKLVAELDQNVNKNNAWLEDKDVSLTYHYRHTPADVCEQQKQLAIQIIKSHGFVVSQAHEAIEAKPPVNWHKGEAALLILKNKFGDDWPQKTKVVFAGDDTTDEDCMRSLQGIAKSFRISADEKLKTYADFRLPQQSLIMELFKWIAAAYKI